MCLVFGEGGEKGTIVHRSSVFVTSDWEGFATPYRRSWGGLPVGTET